MRLAFLTSEYGELGTDRGGLGSHLSRVVPMLADRGHTCEVFLCSGREAENSGVREVRGVLVHQLGPPEHSPFDDLLLPCQVRRHLRSAWRISDELAAVSTSAPFDVLQVANYGAPGVFVDVHTPAVMRFSSHAPTWYAAEGRARGTRVVLGAHLEERAMRNADAYFAPSEFVANLVAEDVGLAVDVVRPPVEPRLDHTSWDDSWFRNETNLERPYVVHAGQLGRLKGTDIVVEAMHRCLAAHPELDVHFCGPDAGASAGIAKLSADFPRRVRYHGRVDPDRLRPLMAGAVGLLTASRADNLPNVVIEAMQVQTPVVGVRDASLDELIVDGYSGLLSSPGSVDSFAQAVTDLLARSEGQRAAMGELGRDRIRDMLASDSCTDALIATYERTCNLGQRQRPSREDVARRLREDLLAARGVERIGSLRWHMRRSGQRARRALSGAPWGRGPWSP